ncbi:hypothetical protein CFC21_034298 [Triticum aestivum]|uniref:pyruvate decarboxylase n=2 Tax=Triticum aestivum TaxID=4565 RepID=A0A9R1JLD7_WHEAT|nr:hypothetical protein CFC21_034298 [Triticum aestivum]
MDIGSVPSQDDDAAAATPREATLGRHLARRLADVGARDVFAVPGDFNLTLLDELEAEQPSGGGVRLVGCCNELNAAYAADGYARARAGGVGACVVTFTVGALSAINAVAGAFSENLPVVCISGGPNSNDYGSNRILHHTIGLPDFSQELRCFQNVTCYQKGERFGSREHLLAPGNICLLPGAKLDFRGKPGRRFGCGSICSRMNNKSKKKVAVVNNLEDAHEQIDTAISTALKESKPVYISISCDLPSIPHPTFSGHHMSLEAAVEAAAAFLNKSVKPVLVGGAKMRMAKARKAFVELADACGYPFAVMPSAKGLVPEHHPRFIGTYWGVVSTPFCGEIVESADAYLFAGPIFNDHTSVGYSLLLNNEKAIIVQPDRVVIGNGPAFGCVLMKDFLRALATRLKKNTAACEIHSRIFVPDGEPRPSEPGEPLRVNVFFKHIQKMLSGNSAVIAETGDSWFNCQKLKLPEGCGYECQLQYGSIGWSVGATMGYAQAAKDKRVISLIGDGSFQVGNNIIFLINNGGYTIEVKIHDGPYNVIKNWNYTGLVEAFHNGEGNSYTAKVRTEEELEEAIEASLGPHKDSLCFIEVIVHKDDTSKELLVWGARLFAANSRPPNPQ